MTTAQSPWRETGDTSLPEFSLALARSWNKNPSPMTEEAEGVYDALWPRSLTRLAAAVAFHETKCGSWNCDTAPKGQPCIPAANRNAWAVKAPNGGWAKYSSFTQAADDWSRRLLDPAGPYRDTRTIDDIVRRYCPVGVDGNTEESVRRYVKVICDEIDNLPLLAQEEGASVAFGNVPRPAWTERLIPDRNNSAWNNLGPRVVRGVVYHRMLGTLWGTDGWFRGGGGASALTDFGMDATSGETLRWNPHDGKAATGVSANRAPWASGPWESPPGDGVAFVNAYGVNAINRDLVSIEISGNYGDPLGTLATDQLVKLTAWLADQARVPWDSFPVNPATGLTFVYWHNEFTKQKPCPGEVVMGLTPAVIDRVRAMLKAAQTGTAPAPIPPAISWPGKPAWMPDWLVKTQFPEAEPGGVRTNAWLAYCAEARRAPSRVKFHNAGTDGELIEFSDGLFIDKQGRRLGG